MLQDELGGTLAQAHGDAAAELGAGKRVYRKPQSEGVDQGPDPSRGLDWSRIHPGVWTGAAGVGAVGKVLVQVQGVTREMGPEAGLVTGPSTIYLRLRLGVQH